MYLRDINGNPYWVPDGSSSADGGDDPRRNCLAQILGWIVGILLGLFMCSCLVSCSSTRKVKDTCDISTEYQQYVDSQQSVIDSLVRVIHEKTEMITNTSRRDSLYTSTFYSDTTEINDSTHTIEHADGTTDNYHYRTERTRVIIHDTIFRQSDTSGFTSIIMELRDSIEHLHASESRFDSIVHSDSTYIATHTDVKKTSVLRSLCPVIGYGIGILLGLYVFYLLVFTEKRRYLVAIFKKIL